MTWPLSHPGAGVSQRIWHFFMYKRICQSQKNAKRKQGKSSIPHQRSQWMVHGVIQFQRKKIPVKREVAKKNPHGWKCANYLSEATVNIINQKRNDASERMYKYNSRNIFFVYSDSSAFPLSHFRIYPSIFHPNPRRSPVSFLTEPSTAWEDTVEILHAHVVPQPAPRGKFRTALTPPSEEDAHPA